ncbi:hypothetical protein Tco_0229858, partial [Tanacetum coccineum]
MFLLLYIVWGHQSLLHVRFTPYASLYKFEKPLSLLQGKQIILSKYKYKSEQQYTLVPKSSCWLRHSDISDSRRPVKAAVSKHIAGLLLFILFSQAHETATE